jgi:very-short-patch-repair endonuclease
MQQGQGPSSEAGRSDDDPDATTAPADLARRRIAAAVALAEQQGGVISRPQLLEIGVTRGQVRAQVSARRWRRWRSQCLAVHTGELSDTGQLWAAVLEAGPRAVLDGASSLLASGLKGFTEESIRISVPRSSRRRRGRGMNVHQTRRYRASDHVESGVPRTKPEVAAVHGALWARSDKQAVLLMTMTVQQGLTTPERLGVAALRIRRDRRRLLVHATILDLLDGVRSISEHEFARACRDRGIPEPSRQVRRQTKDGRYFLDVYWDEWGVVVEIDGIQHGWVQNAVPDALRQNDVTLTHDLVMRLPLLGLRVAADDFFAQVAEALRSRGCPYLDESA